MNYEFCPIGLDAVLLDGREVGVTSVVQQGGQYLVLIDYFDSKGYDRHGGRIEKHFFCREEYHPLSDFTHACAMEILHKMADHPKKVQLENKLPYQRLSKKDTWSYGLLSKFGFVMMHQERELKEKMQWLEEVAAVKPYASDEEQAQFDKVSTAAKTIATQYAHLLESLHNLGIDYHLIKGND